MCGFCDARLSRRGLLAGLAAVSRMCLRFQPRADFAIFSGLMFLVGAGVTCTSEAVGGRDIGRMIKSGDLATVVLGKLRLQRRPLAGRA